MRNMGGSISRSVWGMMSTKILSHVSTWQRQCGDHDDLSGEVWNAGMDYEVTSKQSCVSHSWSWKTLCPALFWMVPSSNTPDCSKWSPRRKPDVTSHLKPCFTSHFLNVHRLPVATFSVMGATDVVLQSSRQQDQPFKPFSSVHFNCHTLFHC